MSIKRFSYPLAAMQIADAFSQTDGLADIVGLFAAMGSGKAKIFPNPDRDQIECRHKRDLLSRYTQLTNNHGDCPLWSSFSLQDNRELLGNLHVLSHIKETGGLFYEIYGTNVAARYNQDLTKTALPLRGNQLSVVFHGVFLASFRRRQVIYTIHQPPEGSVIKDCQRLMLPFSSENGEIHRVLVAHRPAHPARGVVGGVV